MPRRRLIPLLLLFLGAPTWGDETPSEAVEQDIEPVISSNTDRGIIPEGTAMVISTTAVTPTSDFPESNLYEQALEELTQAQVLWAKGMFEAASDTALGAYDNLMEVH